MGSISVSRFNWLHNALREERAAVNIYLLFERLTFAKPTFFYLLFCSLSPLGILPEGQLNPAPEKGLLPVFGGAFSLARMSRRRIRMMALHGVNNLWNPDESIGMTPLQRDVQVRAYPPGKPFESSDEFVTVFKKVVGQFGAVGDDVVDLEQWLDGTRWSEIQAKQAEIEKLEKDLKKRD